MLQLGIFLLVAGCQAEFSDMESWGTSSAIKSAPSGYTFKCTAVGTFPDPYDCTAYHVCYERDSVIEDDQEQCDKGWTYDPKDKTCSIRGTTCSSEPPVPTCTKKDQIGALSKNPSIYYHCVLSADGKYLYPMLYECPHGGYFDGSTFACLSPTTTTTTTTTTAAPTTTPRTTTKKRTTTTKTTTTRRATTTLHTTTAATFHCTSVGLFADMKDCHSYYECSFWLQPVHLKCPTGSYFNSIFKFCVEGTCTNHK